MLHTITSLRAHLGSQAFLDQQRSLDIVSPGCFQVIQIGKVTDLILSEPKGWEEDGKREGRKKIIYIKLFGLWVLF